MKASIEINTTVDVLDQAQADHIAEHYATFVVMVPNEREDLEAIVNAVPENGLIALLLPSNQDGRVVIGEAEEG